MALYHLVRRVAEARSLHPPRWVNRIVYLAWGLAVWLGWVALGPPTETEPPAGYFLCLVGGFVLVVRRDLVRRVAEARWLHSREGSGLNPRRGHGRPSMSAVLLAGGLAALFSGIAFEFLAPAGPFEFLLLGGIALLLVRGFIRLFAEAFPLRPRAGSGLNPRRVTLAVWAVLVTGGLAALIAGATLTELAPTEPAGLWLGILAGVLIVSGMIWMVARRRTLDLGDGEWSVDLDGDGDSGNGGGGGAGGGG